MKNHTILVTILMIILTLTGCDNIGNKTTNISIIYGAISLFSLILLICYFHFIIKKNVWVVLLYSSVLVINMGYFALSVSTTIGEALLANRISYLGSCFLPLCMLMILIDLCNIKFSKKSLYSLILVSIVMFLITASPGYFDFYYKDIYLEITNGAVKLNKIYGSLHFLYFCYLLFYFLLIIFIVIFNMIKNKDKYCKQANIILSVFLGNTLVWLIEQLIDIDFEFLSVSYVITELFLLFLYDMLQDYTYTDNSNYTIKTNNENITLQNNNVLKSEITNDKNNIPKEKADFISEDYQHFLSNISNLTPTEYKIYKLYVSEKSSKEILEILNIKENTLKYHNKNIYSKLGISSRKQLLHYASLENKNKA